MAIDFPKNRTEASITPSGPLQLNDEWYSDGKYYTVVGFNDLGEAVWFGAASRRTEDPTLQDVLNEGNTATNNSTNVANFVLSGTDGIETSVEPKLVQLTGEAAGVELYRTTGGQCSSIFVDDDENLNLRTSDGTEVGERGVYVTDTYVNPLGSLVERKFRVEPNISSSTKGVYNILDPLFGEPEIITFGPSAETDARKFVYKVVGNSDDEWEIQQQPLTSDIVVLDYTNVFNRALQNNPLLPPGKTLDDYNGRIRTLIVPAGSYKCLGNVVRTQPVAIIGEGVNSSKILLQQVIKLTVDGVESNWVLWRTPPYEVRVDGSLGHGQFVFANKGSIVGLSFSGHQSDPSVKPSEDVYQGEDADESGDDVQLGEVRYSAVMFLRAYDDDGIAFNVRNDNRPALGEKKQQDAADMDSQIYDCRFGSSGKGGVKDGALKVYGRNMKINNCFFNSNHTGLVLSFPNRPGETVITAQGGDPQNCSDNHSLSKESQGGIYGWRRVQITNCSFHMGGKATCVSAFGKYQLCGLVFDGNLSDIGGRMFRFESTGAMYRGGDTLSWSNAVGGGLKNCVFSNNTFGNYQKANGSYVVFQQGRYDGVTFTGNCFYGADDTYKETICDEDLQSVKRCGHAILVRATRPEDSSDPRGILNVIRGLVITNNTFSYFMDEAIHINTDQAKGMIISNNFFYNIGCDDPRVGDDETRSKVAAIKLGSSGQEANLDYSEVTGMATGNYMLSENDLGDRIFTQIATVNSKKSPFKVDSSNIVEKNVPPTTLPGTPE